MRCRRLLRARVRVNLQRVKAQLHKLQLVYPPVSNQEAEWLRLCEEDELWWRLRRSNLYMIGVRAEARYEDYGVDAATGCATANFVVPGLGSDPFGIDLQGIAARSGIDGAPFDVELGPKLIRAWSLNDDDSNKDVLDWFTVEKLLFNRWRGHPDVRGLDDYRRFATYELLYVGISKEDDSFTRLVERAHEKRVRILSNERPVAPGARVSDELVFFFFEIEPLQIHIVEDEDELGSMLDVTFDKRRIIADAEKAFTSVLQTKYNTIRFANYPRGGDGLHGQGLDRYGYVIDEDITFTSGGATIRGGYRSGVGRPHADMIFICDGTVDVVRFDESSGETG